MSDVSVPTTPTNPDLREQVQRVLRERCEVEDRQYTDGTGWVLVRDDNAAQVVADYFAPVLEGLRAELDKVSGGWQARIESRAKLHAELGRTRADIEGMTRACAVLIVDANKERESRIAWALEADRLDQEQTHLIKAVLGLTDQRAALSSLLRGMARRVGQMRRNIEIWRIGRDTDAAAWADEEIVRMRAELSTSASDVPGLDVDCTADEAACVHGQTADLTGLAAREDTR